MPRTDIHLDAMLRHLGAAYYESLHGRAARSDVTRALNTVEEHLHEEPQRPASGGSARPRAAAREGRADHDDAGLRRPRGWARRVCDVMNPTVVTVDRLTPYKEIARLLAEHRISGLPVLRMGREVVGVVTEADLLTAEDETRRRLKAASRTTWRPRRHEHHALRAGDLMTEPAITIGPDANVSAAARLMTAHHIRRLPVTDQDGTLIGVVSRRDLLSVFLRPDEDIAADIARLLHEILAVEPGEASVNVQDGVVTLSGTLDPRTGPHGDLIPLTIRLMWDIDGVVDVIDQLGKVQAAPAPPSAQAS
jgi:CBS domain-containing protein